MAWLNKCSLATVAVCMAAMVGCGSAPNPTVENKHETKSENDVKTSIKDIKKISEALGHFIGKSLNAAGINFDVDQVVKGIKEGAAGKPAPMSEEDYEAAMIELQQEAMDTMAEKNLKEAEAFMEKNSKASGVVEVVPGKLQYMILEQGKGSQTVPEHGSPLINYTGKYADGTVFGSSENAGGPITVPIDQTIPGFSKGIAGMKEGEKRRLFVHPDLGYGTTGQLPPNSLLIFDIEVVKAESPDKEAADAFEAQVLDDLDQETDDKNFGETKPAPKTGSETK